MNYNEISLKRPLSRQQAELESKLVSQITDANINAVSFRFEDVLIVTPFSLSEDVYLFIDDEFRELSVSKKTFSELRKAAYETAVKKFGSKQSVTLDLVYDIFAKTGKVSSAYRENLMNRECELFTRFAMPRKFGKKLFDTAKQNGKKVIVSYEGIYPRNVIVKILEICGFESYDGLVISSELNIPFADKKSYFDSVIKTADFPARNILHIGGDVVNDVETAIMKGSKAVIVQPIIPLMVKSGRLRGFIENQHIYDSDLPELFKMRCAFAVYAMYAFDTPQNKIPQSDFCGDEFMLGAAIPGISSLYSKSGQETELGGILRKTMLENSNILMGKKDFTALYNSIFGSLLDKYSPEGCQLTTEFLEKHSAPADRNILMKALDPTIFAEWTEGTADPQLAPVHSSGRKRTALDKLADRLFPPNTKVRNMAESVLHSKKKPF